MENLKNDNTYRLAPIQKGILFHSLEQYSESVYVQQFVCRLSEALDVDAFEKAWQIIIKHHEVLRTSFEWQDLDEPLQSVNDHALCPLKFEDWSSIHDQENRLTLFLKSDLDKGIDLTKAPLLRLALFKFGEADYRLIWTHHHIILDGRSYFTLFNELFEVYAKCSNNEKIELRPSYPYREYIDYLAQHDFSQSEKFWRESLSDIQAPSALIKSVELIVEEEAYLEKTYQLDPQLSRDLVSFAKAQDLTLNTLVQGAWAVLLSRYSAEDKVIFGATRACRHWTEVEPNNRVGIFIGTLPLCINLDADLDVLSWLNKLRHHWVEMREHEHTPLTQIHQWSEIQGDLPLFESILVFENYDLNDALRAQGEAWGNRDFTLHQTTNYPLVLSVNMGSRMKLMLEYETARFDANTIHRMFGHLQTILHSFVSHPGQRLSEIPILTDPEQNQLLVEWNNTATDFPSDKCVHQLFEEQVQKTPDTIAVEFEGQALTYRALNARANQLAHSLISSGVEADSLVGLSVERSIEMIVGLLGILKSGAAYVPLDPGYPEERLKFILEDSGIETVLDQAQLAKINEQNVENPSTEVKPKNLAYVIYTSGSTGKPKGVLVEHKSLLNHNLAMIKQYNLVTEDRLLQFASFNFDVATEEIFPTLLSGATLILWKSERVNAISDLIDFIGQERLTVLNLPAQYWHTWVLDFTRKNQRLPDCLRLVIAGSETVPLETVNVWHQTSNIDLRNAYGPTECTITATTSKTRPDYLASVPIGKPIANTKIFILNQYQKLVPIGVPGELYIGGVGVTRGYLNRPELTAESFVSLFDQRLYRSGDMVRYLANGELEFLGRIDNQVKIRGFRIELGEIEFVIMQSPQVNEGVVIVREDQADNKRIVAYIVGETEGLREFVELELPSYMVPAVFVQLDKMPLTPSGKVDRKMLPAPAEIDLDLEEGFVAPRNEQELKLAIIWQDLLGLSSVSVRDNFFELGGHSLMAITLLSKVEAEFDKAVSVITLFQAPTIAQLADVLNDGHKASSWRALLPIQTQGDNKPLFFIGSTNYARRIIRALGGAQPVYGLNMFGLHVEGETNPDISVEGMAKIYLQEIQLIQPDGPYQLCGFCADAKVAFEMAQQLAKQKQSVSYLGLVDVNWYADISLSLPQRGFKFWRNLTKFGPRYIAHKLKARSVDKENEGVILKAEKEKNDIEQTIQTLPLVLQHQFFIKAFYNALDAYIPQTYEGNVHLILSTEFRSEWDTDARFSQQLSALVGDTVVEEASGYHHTLFSEPQVSKLGELIRRQLERGHGAT